MDVNTRIDRMDEELKLIKNEIKQVLLEIQEHVLAIQNPFTAVVTRGRPDAAADSAADAQLGATPGETRTEAQTPQAPQHAPVGQQPVGAPTAGFPAAPQVLPPAPVYPAYEGQAPTPPPHPVARTESIEHEIERPTDPPRDRSAVSAPDLNGRPASPEKREVDIDIRASSRRDADDDGSYLDGSSDSWTRDESDEFEREPASGEPGATADDTNVVSEETEHPRRSTTRGAGAGPSEPSPKTRLDLATLASLVQWTHRVVQDTGADYAATLFEISEMTGRLSSDLQQVLLAVVRLLGKEASGSTDSATKAVTLLAQLDGLMGNTTQEDARLLPFLMRGDLEVLPLIQR